MKNYKDYTSRAIQKEKILNSFKYIIMILFALISIYPFIWVLITSFKHMSEIHVNPFGLPKIWDLENYKLALEAGNLLLGFLNSFLYAIVATIAVTFLSSMAAYVIARIYKKFILYIYFTFGIMIPVHAIIIPLFTMMGKLKLIDTRFGVILIYIAINLSFSIFILVSFMRNIPVELEEAARIDGASMPRTFFTIILPVIKPALATVSTFTFLFCWNDLIVALLMASNPRIRTLNLSVYTLRSMYYSDFGLISAGLVYIIIPMTIIYILFQNQIVEGLTAGAVKQ